MQNLLFYFGFSTLLAHELDAMTQSEWRLLFVLRNLLEPLASNIFVLAHVPVVALLLWLTSHQSLSTRYWSRLVIALFAVIHVALHKHLEHHPAYTFTSPLSLALIYGAGVFGFVYAVFAIKSPTFSASKTPTKN